jgi:hypothetical protein
VSTVKVIVGLHIEDDEVAVTKLDEVAVTKLDANVVDPTLE